MWLSQAAPQRKRTAMAAVLAMVAAAKRGRRMERARPPAMAATMG